MNKKNRRAMVPYFAAAGIAPVAIAAVSLVNCFEMPRAHPEGLVYLARTQPPIPNPTPAKQKRSNPIPSAEPTSSPQAHTYRAIVAAVIDVKTPGLMASDLVVLPGSNADLVELKFVPDVRTTEVDSGKAPRIVYLYDASSSVFTPMSDPNGQRIDASINSLGMLPKGAEVAVGRFGYTNALDVQIGDFTSNRESTQSQIEDLRQLDLGGTPLWDALDFSIENLLETPGERSIVLFSDGEDGNSTLATQEDVIDMAKQNQIKIHVVALGSGDFGAIRDVAQQTGGQFVGVADASQLIDAFAAVGEKVVRREDRSYYEARWEVVRKNRPFQKGEVIPLKAELGGKVYDLSTTVEAVKS